MTPHHVGTETEMTVPAPTASALLRPARLEDRYQLDRGPSYISGTQALVRLLLNQRARDRAAGLNTAGFVSGYRGSPLARMPPGDPDWRTLELPFSVEESFAQAAISRCYAPRQKTSWTR